MFKFLIKRLHETYAVFVESLHFDEICSQRNSIVMKILLLGSGGREHALARSIASSSKCEELFIAPGNPGTSALGTNLAIGVNDFDSIKSAVFEHNINMVVVGPEDPLVNGIRDFFEADDSIKAIPVIGPKAKGAQLEGSKDFSKEFMFRNNIPTAQYKTFDGSNLEEGYTFLESLKAPYVLKADGLAAGKGVLIIEDLAEAKASLKEMISEAKFGDASSKVVIEEFLTGIEISVFAMTDEKGYVILGNAKDYKRIGEGDTGLNTGGMGCVSPVPFADEEFLNKVEEQVIKPTIDGMIKEDLGYRGFVYFGLMNINGEPFVIEYNARMGDPETEIIMPRIKNDFVEILEATVNQTIEDVKIDLDPRHAATVIMVSGGYPEAYPKGKVITGTSDVKGSIVFHAGTKLEGDQLVTSGGRVLAITSFGADIFEALETSYTAMKKINFEGAFYRKDLGFDLKKYKIEA